MQKVYFSQIYLWDKDITLDMETSIGSLGDGVAFLITPPKKKKHFSYYEKRLQMENGTTHRFLKIVF